MGGRVGCANVIVETHARYSAGISNEEAQQVVAARKRQVTIALTLPGANLEGCWSCVPQKTGQNEALYAGNAGAIAETKWK